MIIKHTLLPAPPQGAYAKGRGGMRPDVIVIHIMEGTMQGTDTHFRRGPEVKNRVSAHYGVSKEGQVVQWVDDLDQAWHAGVVDRPTAQIVKDRPGISPNKYAIGIECEGFCKDDPPPILQLTAIGELVRVLAGRHKIPLTRKHIIGHNEIRASKPCPCKIDVDQVLAVANMGMGDRERMIRAELEEIQRRLDRIKDLL